MGDNIYLGDRNGVRTPMQWSADRNAGFSGANPQQLYSAGHHRSRVPLRSGQRRGPAEQPPLAALVDEAADRAAQALPAFGRGTPRVPAARATRKILAFIARTTRTSVIWWSPTCRGSCSTSSSICRRFAGRRAGRDVRPDRSFPPIGKQPYLLTLGPHAFYWFALETETDGLPPAPAAEPPLIRVGANNDWQGLSPGRTKKQFEAVLRRALPERPWFGGAARSIQSLSIHDSIALNGSKDSHAPRMLILRVEYLDGEPDEYLLPLGDAWGQEARESGGVPPRNRSWRNCSGRARRKAGCCTTQPSIRPRRPLCWS